MSRAFRNTMATIAMSQSIGDILEANYKHRKRNKTIMAHVSKLKGASHEAFKLWPGEVDLKTLEQIGNRLKRFEDAFFLGRKTDVTIYTSLSLALLEDMLRFIQDRRKVFVIDQLIKAVLRVHKYFDSKLDRHEDYKKADQAVRCWRALEV